MGLGGPAPGRSARGSATPRPPPGRTRGVARTDGLDHDIYLMIRQVYKISIVSERVRRLRCLTPTAEAFDADLLLHCPLSPITFAAGLQVVFGAQNVVMQEQSLGLPDPGGRLRCGVTTTAASRSGEWANRGSPDPVPVRPRAVVRSAPSHLRLTDPTRTPSLRLGKSDQIDIHMIVIIEQLRTVSHDRRRTEFPSPASRRPLGDPVAVAGARRTHAFKALGESVRR